MVEVLSTLGVAAFGIVSLAVGTRLLWLGSRTRQTPELAIGTGFVVGVLFGFIPETLLYSTELIPEPWQMPLVRVAEIAIRLCAIAILVFTWRVFRPDSPWALALVVALAGTMLASHFYFPFGRIHAATMAQHAAATCSFAARTLAFVWGSVEALDYYASSRRRLALGLADPVVTNRFLLWGVALAASSFIMGSVLLAPVFGLTAAEPSWLLAESAFGSLAAVSIWLTFFPPRWYRDWLSGAGRAGAPA